MSALYFVLAVAGALGGVMVFVGALAYAERWISTRRATAAVLAHYDLPPQWADDVADDVAGEPAMADRANLATAIIQAIKRRAQEAGVEVENGLDRERAWDRAGTDRRRRSHLMGRQRNELGRGG